MKKGDYDRAQSLLARAYLQNPDSIETRYQLALVDLKLQQVRAAYSLLQAAERKDHFKSTVSLPIRIELAKLYISAKRYGDAEARLLRVLEKDPHNRDARTLLATSLALQAQPAAARAQLDVLLTEDPASLNARVLDATLDLVGQKVPQAEASLLEEVTLTKRSTDSLTALANFYQVTQQRPKAIELLTELIRREPRNVSLRLQLGKVYAKMGDRADAEKTFREAGQMAPSNRVAVMALTDYYVQLADWAKAATELEALVKKSGKNPDAAARSLLAAVYYRGHRPADAQKLAAELIKESPDPGAHMVYGLLHLDGRNYQGAILEFNQVLHTNPESAAAQYLLALAYIGAGKEQMGVQQMAQTLKLNNEFLPARLWLIDYYLRRGSEDAAWGSLRGLPESQASVPEVIIMTALCDPLADFTPEQQQSLRHALLVRPQFISVYENYGITTLLRRYGGPLREQLEAMIKKFPQYRPARTLLVTILEAQGRTYEAMAQVQKRVAANPNSPEDLLVLARLQIARGQIKAARATLAKAAAIQPENPEVMVRRAQVEADSSNFDAAVLQLDALTEHFPKSSEAWSFKAILFQQHGDLAKARTFYEEALKDNGNNAVAENNLGLLLATAFHDPQGGLEMARKAHSFDPSKPEFADTLGWVQYLAGEIPDSLATLGDAVRMKPNDASFRYHLGMAQSRSNRTQEALANLEKALHLNPNLPEASEIKATIGVLGIPPVK
jgi:Flp pilus assembly protein TadD